jgi:hypothetical protein
LESRDGVDCDYLGAADGETYILEDGLQRILLEFLFLALPRAFHYTAQRDRMDFFIFRKVWAVVDPSVLHLFIFAILSEEVAVKNMT